MEPIDFKHSNKTLQAPDPKATEEQYGDAVTEIVELPVWTDGIHCVSCWKMSWREPPGRARIIVGRWVHLDCHRASRGRPRGWRTRPLSRPFCSLARA